MGLDLALGALILFSALRGWLKGFLVQAIRLGGLIASVYAAGPVRDQIKPYAAGQLVAVKPEVLDRLLWWVSGVGSFFVIVGVASLIVAVSRRKTFGMDEGNRADQFAGFGFGAIKGVVVAAFVIAALQTYAEPQLAQFPWAAEQKKESYAWQWHQEYRPAKRIWQAPPVKHFVARIQKMGLIGLPAGLPEIEVEGEPKKPIQTASRTPRLSIPKAAPMREARTKVEHIKADPSPIDRDGLDPELASSVQSMLGKLHELEDGTR